MPFAPVHFNSGPVVVTWNAQQIGYFEDGAEIFAEPRYDEIMSDDMGGSRGVPTDKQFLGAIATVQGVLTKYVKALADKLINFNAATLAAGSPGLYPTIGSFVRQDGLAAQLILPGVNDTLTFTTAHLVRGIQFGAGTRARRYSCAWECWMNQTDFTALTSAQTRRLFTVS